MISQGIGRLHKLETIFLVSEMQARIQPGYFDVGKLCHHDDGNFSHQKVSQV